MSFLQRTTDRRTRRQAAKLLVLSTLAAAATFAVHAADNRHERHGQAAGWCADRCDEVVIDWNATAYQVIKASNGYADPMAASRVLAMMHLAMHDALNATRPRYATYTQLAHDAGADPAVAAVTAAHDVLVALFPQQKDTLLKAALDKSIVDAGKGADVVRGSALGKAAAAAMLQARSADGSDGSESYREGTQPGEYRFTPPFDFVAAPHWRSVQPFALTSPSQFRSAPPPALNSAEYARAFDEVKYGGSDRPDAARTQDQTHYAAFWYEFSDIGWNRIARVVSRDHKQDLWQRARTFALLNVAMADSYVAGWDSKMHYNLWRPITAIHHGGGGAGTVPDTSWKPLLTTPPVQDYPSTHSALGAAAAQTLAHAFGRDRLKFEFSSTSAVAANPMREFRSFSEAARENADSRVRAGLHFRFATSAGLALGDSIGRFTVEHHLKPLY